MVIKLPSFVIVYALYATLSGIVLNLWSAYLESVLMLSIALHFLELSGS